jgi:hypothetical protein
VVFSTNGHFRTTYYAATLANPTSGLFIGSGMPDVSADDMVKLQAWLFRSLCAAKDGLFDSPINGKT